MKTMLLALLIGLSGCAAQEYSDLPPGAVVVHSRPTIAHYSGGGSGNNWAAYFAAEELGRAMRAQARAAQWDDFFARQAEARARSRLNWQLSDIESAIRRLNY